MLWKWRLALVWLAVICTPAALAMDTTGWCGSVTGSPVIACDDFDDYCVDPPCDDGVGDDTPDQAALLAVWPSDGCMSAPDALGQQVPSNALVASDDTCGEWIRTWNPVDLCWDAVYQSGTSPCEVSAPLALRSNVGAYYPDAKNDQYVFDGASHHHDLRSRIEQLDPAMGSVNGTDENPLVLQFVMGLPGDSMARFDAAQANRYIELTDGSDRASAEVQIVVCGLLDDPPNPKYRPQIAYPAGMDGLNHSSIAVGVFAVLEQGGVCDNEPIATLYRFAVYNGERWYEMKGNLPLAGNSEMKTAGGPNVVTMTIKSSFIEVTLENTWDQDADGSGRCEDADGVGEPFTGTSIVPRVYDGAFSRMHIGNGACLPSRKQDYVDDVALTGGVLEPPISTGACCLVEGGCVEETTLAGCENQYAGTFAGADTTCEQASCPSPTGACCLPTGVCDETMDQAQCLAAGGAFSGAFSLCADTLCCADPFADADGDGDVDQGDFGLFQVCYTGVAIPGTVPVCACFDRDGDTDVDDDDLAAFEACATGPGIPSNPGCE